MKNREINETDIDLASLKVDMKYLIGGVNDIKETVNNFDKRINDNEDDIIRIKKDQSMWNYGLAAITTIVGAISAIIGLTK